MGVTANTQCGFCNDEKDSIEHMFWECACIRRFWTSLETTLKEKCETALNVKFTQNLVLFGTEIDIKTDTLFDLVILQAKQFIYKCKLDKCLPTLSCFLQQLMLKYKIDEYSGKISGELPTFILTWLCYKPILKTENGWPQGICSYFRFRIYTHVTGSQSLIVQGKYLSMKYFVQLFVCMDVYMDVSFCLLCMYNMCCTFVYVCYPLLERCIDMFYNCVIFRYIDYFFCRLIIGLTGYAIVASPEAVTMYIAGRCSPSFDPTRWQTSCRANLNLRKELWQVSPGAWQVHCVKQTAEEVPQTAVRGQCGRTEALRGRLGHLCCWWNWKASWRHWEHNFPGMHCCILSRVFTSVPNVCCFPLCIHVLL